MKSFKIFYYIVCVFIGLITILLIVSVFPVTGNFKVKVVESGSMESAIKTGSIITIKPEEDYKIGDIVTFHGWLSKSELQAVFKRAQIFVLPSSKEGLPLAGIQAMASGLVLVGSDVIGINDIIQHGKNGYLFPNRDEKKMVYYLAKLIKNKEHLVNMQSQSILEAEKFKWDKIAEKYHMIYRNGE